jgi:hypothetical protein
MADRGAPLNGTAVPPGSKSAVSLDTVRIDAIHVGDLASIGVDGDGDGRADIHNDADGVHSAAHYLTKSGVRAGVALWRRGAS